MQSGRKYITLFIYILMGYTILQFFWWTYLIFELNAEIIALEKVILEYASSSPEGWEIAAKGDLDAMFAKKKLMIAGEGVVFLIILLSGFYLIRRSHERELSLARQEQNFMLAITHELNSPLAAIKLNIETLSRRELPMDKVRLILGRMSQDTERLNVMINNILAASRMVKKGFELFPEAVNIKEFLMSMVKKYERHIPQDLIISGPDNVIAQMDPFALELILQNLMENASKYGGETTPIHVFLESTEDNFVIHVKDQGMGISPEEKLKITSKFYRIGDEITRKSKGTGLGLFLVDNLVKEMGGNLTISDNTPQGSIFSISIPMN